MSTIVPIPISPSTFVPSSGEFQNQIVFRQNLDGTLTPRNPFFDTDGFLDQGFGPQRYAANSLILPRLISTFGGGPPNINFYEDFNPFPTTVENSGLNPLFEFNAIEGAFTPATVTGIGGIVRQPQIFQPINPSAQQFEFTLPLPRLTPVQPAVSAIEMLFAPGGNTQQSTLGFF